MPRQSRSGGGSRPSRPVASARPAPHQQSRPATTAAYPPPARTNQTSPAGPPATASAPQQSSAPGLFGQMASTAA
jgi:hypothetical protein